ncbi:hypothetical protein LWM68_07445 [Niabella sp. W65]|nr:hypothetical protein [Niabella sp. W65]MCH7362620.1 hypothetical protein [Niabella sp. W65]ULT38578.1 hypothetical protein KRR40_26125 [Niabella sp. I65]
MKTFKYFLRGGITCFLTVGLCIASLAQQKQKPNIVLILVDDLGFSDIEPYGGRI